MRGAGGAGGSGDQGTSTCPVTEPEHCPEKEGEAQPGCQAPLCPSRARPPRSPEPPYAVGWGPMINDAEGCNQIVVPLAPSHD